MRRLVCALLVLLVLGALMCFSLNRTSPDMVQKHLIDSVWVSNNGATISFSLSGEAHVSNATQGIDVDGTYAVYVQRKWFKEKIIVDVSISPDERYAEYVLLDNTLTSENGFCYYAT